MKCLIVDDERAVRDSIRRMGQWRSFGIDALLEADSADEALAVIDRERPQIVITDMKMGAKGGVELLQSISGMADAPQVMVLSGFSDYAYMHSALLAGAAEYLLKPVGAERFNEALRRTVSLCASRAGASGGERRQAAESAYMRAITHELSEYPMMNSFLAAHARCLLFCFRIFELPEVCARSFQSVPDLLFYTVQTELEGELASRFEVRMFLLNGGHFGSLEGVLALEERAAPEDAHQALSRAAREVSLRNGFRSMLAFSEPFHGAAGLSEALAQTMRGINCAPVSAGKAVNVVPPYSFDEGLRYRASDEDREALQGLLLEGQPEPLLDRVEDILGRLRARSQLSLRSLDEVFLEVHRLFREQLEARGAQDRVPEEYRADELRVQLHHNILNPGAQRQLLAAFLAPGMEVLRGSTNQLAVQMKDYIDRHYGEKINLQTLSDRFFVSREYASRLFKREMGSTFIAYLTEVRLNRAAQLLLHTDASLAEIAQQTGFKESAYLIRVFIKRYNMTPREYRRSRGRGG